MAKVPAQGVREGVDMNAVKDFSLGAVVVALDGLNADGAAVDWAVDEAVRRGRPVHIVASGSRTPRSHRWRR
jgi:hypothetical protein